MFSPPEPIYTVAGIRILESQVSDSADPSLMERAGRVAAEAAVRLTADRPGTILIVCGPGNNGGDGFVMARRLLQARRAVTVVFAGNAERLPADARTALNAWHEAGGSTLDALPAEPDTGWALVVDALFGIGLQRPIKNAYRDWIKHLNALACPRLALDVPSGIDADTGRVLGIAFNATHTLSFIALKPGLLTLDGPDHAGVVSVHPLDVAVQEIASPNEMRVRPSMFHEHLAPRRLNTHKGSFGNAGILGGASGMIGATLLSGRAALNLGAGRIFVGMMDRDAPSVDAMQPELMLRMPNVVLKAASVFAVGPGLGTSDDARRLMERVLPTPVPLVLDADALNLIAAHDVLEQLCTRRQAPTLLTPHPAEAARLLGRETEEVQTDRIRSATELAQRFNALVALKGCGTIIALPDGRWHINCTGHPGMASAGMGDVLTGLITALLAQHWPPEAALTAAVHLHGTAAEQLAADNVGPIGLTASEVITAARRIFNAWLREAGNPPVPDA